MWIVLWDVLVAGVIIEFLICINYSVVVLDYIVGYMPRHQCGREPTFSEVLEMRGVAFTFLMAIFSRTLFREKYKFEVEMTHKSFQAPIYIEN
jgi:hypothetical protein